MHQVSPVADGVNVRVLHQLSKPYPTIRVTTHMESKDLDVSTLVGRRAVNRWDRVSVGDLFERVRWSTPDKEAVIGRPGSFAYETNARLSYREADELANRVANGLLGEGLVPGDRVAFFCENSVEAYIAKFGVAKAGGVAAPINPRVAVDVQRHLLDILQPRFAFVDSELFARAASSFDAIGLRGVVIPINGGELPDGWYEFKQFVDAHLPTEPDVSISGDDIWEVIPTSGTTSMPKCVMLSHNMAYLNAFVHGLSHTRGLIVESDLRIASLLPVIYHAADHSHSFPAFVCGGTFVIGREVSGREHAAAVSDERITALHAGSAQFLEEMVVAVDEDPARYDLSSLTSILWAWAPLRPGTAQILRELCGNVQLVEILGQTESLSSTRFRFGEQAGIADDAAPIVNRVGLPNALLSAALVQADGSFVPVGDSHQPGEIVYRSPVLTAGYYRDPEATRESFRGGWFHSGDACEYEEKGSLIMIDRLKDVIKSGGENVSSLRVETTLNGYPGVSRVAVIGVPHPRWGEAVVAVVVREDGAELHEDLLLNHCKRSLAGFECPKKIIFADELPLSIGNKVKKVVLRQLYAGLFEEPMTR